jgi:hypothetical protein
MVAEGRLEDVDAIVMALVMIRWRRKEGRILKTHCSRFATSLLNT